ncbi:MAG: hypothetical protein HYY18_02250 [Planctomycetes bacterium]|nr:hypothetical protein [Planctomycetota bacterium]
MSVLSEKVRTDSAVKPRIRRERSAGPKIAGGGDDSRRIAAAILEVLGGARLPSEAATSLGVSQARYYALESRALSGFVEACEPRPKGRQRRPESQVAQLERELERLGRENARLSALVRVARRAVGLSEAPEKKREPGGKPRRRRKATARALGAVAVLRAPAAPSGPPSPPAPQDP